MATSENTQEDARRFAFRMPVLDEGLFKAVEEAIKKGGQTGILTLAVQDVAEVREELAEVQASIERLHWLFLQHSHNDSGQVVVPAAAAQEELYGPGVVRPVQRILSGNNGRPKHPYIRRILEACEDAARLSAQVTPEGPQA